MQLLKSQQNEILGLIQQRGLDPSDFLWRVRQGPMSEKSVSMLEHRPTQGYFIFDFLNETHWTEFSPGREKRVERQYPGPWQLQLQYVHQWLINVSREYEAPDLWTEIGKERELVEAAATAIANDPFSEEELGRIAGLLRELQAFVEQTQDMTPSEREALEARLRYLEEASTRQGRVDWANNLVGVLMGFALQAILPPEVVREMFRLAGRGLGALLGGELPGLPS